MATCVFINYNKPSGNPKLLMELKITKLDQFCNCVHLKLKSDILINTEERNMNGKNWRRIIFWLQYSQGLALRKSRFWINLLLIVFKWKTHYQIFFSKKFKVFAVQWFINRKYLKVKSFERISLNTNGYWKKHISARILDCIVQISMNCSYWTQIWQCKLEVSIFLKNKWLEICVKRVMFQSVTDLLQKRSKVAKSTFSSF